MNALRPKILRHKLRIFYNAREVIITSTDSIIPRKWAHHQIAYDDESGLIEYRIDGKIQAVRYVTSTQRESGEVYNARLGVPADIEICTKYSGFWFLQKEKGCKEKCTAPKKSNGNCSYCGCKKCSDFIFLWTYGGF